MSRKESAAVPHEVALIVKSIRERCISAAGRDCHGLHIKYPVPLRLRKEVEKAFNLPFTRYGFFFAGFEACCGAEPVDALEQLVDAHGNVILDEDGEPMDVDSCGANRSAAVVDFFAVCFRPTAEGMAVYAAYEERKAEALSTCSAVAEGYEDSEAFLWQVDIHKHAAALLEQWSARLLNASK